jgi:GDP/UDP-N,N'-diacetylbacillosamine 2-epimerase (hydrolysing)
VSHELHLNSPPMNARVAQRRVTYLSGTRADFGLMSRTLQAIAHHPKLSLNVLVTGMHLSERYGMTVHDIEAQGFDIASCIDPLDPHLSTPAAMARNVGHLLMGMTAALEKIKPDVLLLLGDRGEMLAGAIAAIHLSIAVVHVHGGERSGTVDEPIRHAISKLSHVHLVATAQSRERLLRMGENQANVHITGAPGLDDLLDCTQTSRLSLCKQVGFDAQRPVALMLYHPVLNEVASAGQDTCAVAQAALQAGCQVLALMPNSDAGNDAVRHALTGVQQQTIPREFVLKTHLPRAQFISWLACADVLIGNSSSGIIEAASFGTPVINVGSRQYLRERNANVLDVSAQPHALSDALAQVLQRGRFSSVNLYGDGQTAGRIAQHLAALDISPTLMAKCNAY